MLVKFNEVDETPPDDKSEMLAEPPAPELLLLPVAITVAPSSDIPPPVALSITEALPDDVVVALTDAPF
jgi:hypothetical protein